MAGVAVDRPPGLPGQRRPGQDQPAGAERHGHPRRATAAGRAARTADRGRAPPPRHRPHRRSPPRRPPPRRPPTARAPGLRGRVSRRPRRVRHNASSASSGSRASPTARPARYSELEANVSVMVPGSPAGTTQPCCHPLTATGVKRDPALVRATQPGLMLSGMTSTRDGGRGGRPHLAAIGTPGPGRRRNRRRAVRHSARSGAVSCGAVHDELRRRG